MASLDWHLGRSEGVTFVEVAVTSETDTRVEVESMLRPVWPPRVGGRPVAGWENHRFTGTVEAGSRLVFGYASPAEPETPPATIVGTEPPSEDTGDDAQQLVGRLGRAEPPRDAVPLPEVGSVSGSRAGGETDTAGANAGIPDLASSTPEDRIAPTDDGSDRASNRGPAESSACHTSPGETNDDRQFCSKDSDSSSREPMDSGSTNDRSREGASGERTTRQTADTEVCGQALEQKSGTDADLSPGEIVSWLGEVEERLETARRLDGAESVAETRRIVRSVGGIEGVRALDRELANDSRRFDRFAERLRAVETELESVTVPVSELERLA